MTHDTGRIRFVTRRFHELQGYRAALLGGCLLAGVGLADHIAEGASAQLAQIVAFGCIALASASDAIARYYRARFGDVHIPGRQAALSLSVAPHLGLAFDCLFLVTGRAGPSLAAVLLAASSLVILIRDWPWRVHHTIGVVAGVVAALGSGSVLPVVPLDGGFLDPRRTEAFIGAYFLVGLSLLVTGCLDHRLLIKTLPGAKLDERAEDTIRTDRRPRDGVTHGIARAAIATPLLAAFGILTLSALWPPPALLLFSGLLVFAIALGVHLGSTSTRMRGNLSEAGTASIGGQTRVCMAIIGVAIVADMLLAQRGWPSAAALAIASWSAWIVVRDWPYRIHYLGSVGAGLVAAVLHIGVRSAAAQQQWWSTFLLLMSVALFVEGLLDHLAFGRIKQRA
jgi:hypothetical protein